MKNRFEVQKVTDRQKLSPWLLQKHYAKRKPSISHAFELYDMRLSDIIGIVTYGPPPSPQVGRGFLGEDNRLSVLELNRLVINSDAPRNSASFLISKSMKMIPKCCIVSYADQQVGHKGYVYQACNFIYCGAERSHQDEFLIDGHWTHARTLTGKGISAPKKWANENGIIVRSPKPKHRYIFFTDKKLRKFLRYESLPYPKGNTLRYECEDVVDGSLGGKKFEASSSVKKLRLVGRSINRQQSLF